MRISPNTIYQWLEEDLPYFDLTTQVLGVGGMQADFVGGFAAIEDCVARILAQDCEKQILLEVESAEDLEAVMHLPIHGIQYDKINPDELSVLVAKVRKVNPQLSQLAAGGITLDNAALYAATGVDGLVTTAVYFGKPADVGVRFVKL